MVTEAVWSPMTEFGVQTDWAVRFTFQSPTGDSSDFISRDIPCLDKQQAEWIVASWQTAWRRGNFLPPHTPSAKTETDYDTYVIPLDVV